MGDSINVASRIQSLGQANTILFSKEIFDKIKNQPGFNYVYLASADIQKAIDYLEESYKIHTLYMLFLKIEPIFDQIRNEPALKPY